MTDTPTGYPRARGWFAALGLILILAGAWLAASIQTSGGISVRDIRFAGTNGTTMSALLYVPRAATAATPAPGILAVHGYINSRETQDGFAIEFARRGYVVLALDQTGHGYSGGKAFSNGFGGPDGLAYLRSLPMVDKEQIGLEGHSMGGWTVLAAAAAMPDAYRSIVLEGSSTGAPYAKDGSPAWPRNLALVYSLYDEFSGLMWDSPRAMDLAGSAKLQRVFGSGGAVEPGKLYGSVDAGTARVLYQPATTHPGDHISSAAIGHATDWFARTLKGGTPLPASDQLWYWKEIGTGIGLVGFVLLILGTFDLLLRNTPFRVLQAAAIPAVAERDARWRRGMWLTTLVPVLLFFPVFIAIFLLVPATVVLPQTVTTQVALWALLCAGAGILLRRFGPVPVPTPASPWLAAIGLALATVAVGYLVVFLVDRLFITDLRLWILAVKWPSAWQWNIASIYLVPITIAYLVTLRGVHGLMVQGDSAGRQYRTAMTAMAGAFAGVFALVYAGFFVTGTLITGFDPLSTVIALQFVAILPVIAIIATFAWRRTGSHRAGALIVGLLVTLYVCAGTATQG
ncbi:alpha/beta hydrolase family protein [Sphingomonas alpina]|uniref:Alpha/beta fold hydrolase n=1 Tax=Sphingomonas alpina TaxID=653931 RepID=A0A7H0LPK0_9SPHN|nr:alpha/beta fold hydrolase [Sphingomonas alpina]QNQ11603.1 alpha/beta fold hydrolase [Sphingomonas alpina]